MEYIPIGLYSILTVIVIAISLPTYLRKRDGQICRRCKYYDNELQACWDSLGGEERTPEDSCGRFTRKDTW